VRPRGGEARGRSAHDLNLFLIASAAPAPFNDKVDLGGRSIQIDCLGKGTPTVIVEPELSASATNNPAWRAIALRVAPVTQICLYDRAGRGGSDRPPAGKRSSDDIATQRAP